MRIVKSILGLIVVGLIGFAISWAVYAPRQDIRGTWATEGYGYHLDIGRAVVDLYEVTAISCHRTQRIPAHQWLLAALEDVRFARDGDQLQVVAGGTLNPITANRTDGLPAHCPQTPDQPGTAQDNFDVLWQAMDEHYAFFELHGVDWQARRTAHRPADDAVLSDDALFELFKVTLDGLDDGHLYIRRTDGSIHSPSVRPDWHADRHMVRDNTLSQFDELTAISGTGLLYGWATPEIGYVYMTHMNADGGFNLKAADMARDSFAEIAAQFADTKGIILDLRYNPGGSDDIALAYAGYFTDRARHGFSKSTRTATGYTAPFEVTLEPAGTHHLDQPVVVLTSGFTGSAAEIFTMLMRDLPQVTIMGTPTSGGLSDIGNFTLPNGWELGLSHQRYVSTDGISYEGDGIPPDVMVTPDVDAARNGTDTILQSAITRLTR